METTPRPRSAIADELLDRYLLGRATPEEQHTVEESMRSVPGFAEWTASVRMAKAPREEMIQAGRLRDRIREEAGLEVVGPGVVGSVEKRTLPLREGSQRYEWSFGRTQTLWRWISSSAVVLVLAIAFILLRPVRQTPVTPIQTYVTRSGEQATVTARDGTQFILSPNTTLRLFDFETHTRTVELNGEAYIDVAHESGLPFIVKSGNVNVQVLGTGFLIRHGAGTHTRIAVTEGKVRLITESKNGSVTLTAGQIGDVIDSTVHVSTVEELNPKTEWTREQLVFRDTPLSTILATISQWYGYQFRYADSTLAHRTLTLGISTQSSMKALAEIERVLHVSISVVGDTVTLIPQSPTHMNGTSRMNAYDVWTPSKEAGR